MEKQRWGDKPFCGHCGAFNVRQLQSRTGEREKNFRWLCRDCGKLFSIRTGTVLEESRIPVRHWCNAFWRAATSKKGVSALEIHRQTGVSYKSALFMMHRIRFAMDEQDVELLSGDVEVDEVFIGGVPRRIQNSRKTFKKPKSIVVGLKQRGGKIRPVVVADVTGATLKQVIRENVHPSARVMTDDWSGYRGLTNAGWKHETVCHSRFEYVRGDVHTNSIEGFFGMLRRGLDGIFHSVSKKHLHRYMAEFEFRHNHGALEDGQRVVQAIKSANGKRLTYADQVGQD